MTTETRLELFKLDPIDQKTLFWMMDNKPESVRSWINYISYTYKRNRTTVIDAEKFFEEVAPELDQDFNQSSTSDGAKKILLVDDDKTFNFLHTRMLEITGVAGEVESTLNGAQAMRLLETCEGRMPDVILLDLSMPVMDGFGFIEAFRNADIPGKESIKIIVVTSSNDYRDRNKVRELGIEHFLTKPINEKELSEAIGNG